MSGMFRSTQNLFHIGPGKNGANDQGRSNAELRLGKNKHPYYGNTAAEVIDQKHGMRRYANSVLGKRGSKQSASSQLLGGGG